MRAIYTTFLVAMMIVRPCRGASSDNSSDDGSDKTYYWQGNTINNLNRLTQGSPDFEQDQQHGRLHDNANQYLTGIRQQMAHQAAADADKKRLLTLQGVLPGDPLEVTYDPSGVQVTLHEDMLFSENSTAVKIGAVDVLDRLRGLLRSSDQRPVHLIISDRLDDTPQSSQVDAERTLMVVGLLEFPGKGANAENLAPEPLTPQ